MSPPSPPRSSCPLAAALDLFGDRWTLLILRDLLLDGRSQFAELAAMEGIATNTLSERLQRLLDAALIVRRRDPADGRRWIYAPTPRAVALVPAMVEMILWGNNYTEGRAPPQVLAAAAVDKAALIAGAMAQAAARVPAGEAEAGSISAADAPDAP